MEFSKQYIGSLLVILAMVFQIFKVDFSQEQLQNTVDLITQLFTTLTALISAIIVAIARYKKGDINALGAKKRS